MNRGLLILVLLAISFQMKGQSLIMPAGFEKAESLTLRWNDDPALDSTMARIAAALPDNSIINMLYQPGSDTLAIQNYLLERGVSIQLRFIPVATLSPWIAESGPISGYIYNSEQFVRFFYDPSSSTSDDLLPLAFGDYLGIPVNEMQLNLNAINIQFDGLKRGFVSDLVVQDNPQYTEAEIVDILKAYFHVDDFMVIPSPIFGNNGRISLNQYFKMLDSETILLAKLPENCIDYDLLEAIATELGQASNSFGRTYHIIRIPVSPANDGSYPNSPEDEFRSYTSCIQLNNVLVLPSFGTETDNIAQTIMQNTFPGYSISNADATYLSAAYKGLDQMSFSLPQLDLFRLKHYRLDGIQDFLYEMPVSCYPQSNWAIDSIIVHYKTQSDSDFRSGKMFPGCPGYIGVISDITPADTISYYLAGYSNGQELLEPLSAPNGSYKFWSLLSTSVDETIGLKSTDLSIFPNPSQGFITLNIPTSFGSKIDFRLYDSEGILSYSEQIGNSVSMIELPHQLKNGVYLASINNGSAAITKVLILQRP